MRSTAHEYAPESRRPARTSNTPVLQTSCGNLGCLLLTLFPILNRFIPLYRSTPHLAPEKQKGEGFVSYTFVFERFCSLKQSALIVPSLKSLSLSYLRLVLVFKKVSWTCHEHAGAWSRSGSLQSGSGSVGFVSPAFAASYPPVTGGGPATAASAGGPGGTIGGGESSSGHVCGSEKPPPVSSDSDSGCRGGVGAAAADDDIDDHVDDDKAGEGQKSKKKPSGGSSISTGGSPGKTGLGVIARIKGRFGRHAG